MIIDTIYFYGDPLIRACPAFSYPLQTPQRREPNHFKGSSPVQTQVWHRWREKEKDTRGRSIIYLNLNWDWAQNLIPRSKAIHTLIDPLITPLAALGQEIDFFISWFSSSARHKWQRSTETMEKERQETWQRVNRKDLIIYRLFVFFLKTF